MNRGRGGKLFSVGEKKQQNNLKLNLLSHGFSNKTNTTFHGRERAFWTCYSL